MTAADSSPVPSVIGDNLYGFSLIAGGANVIMQLSKLPVGHGVATSTVDSGRVDKHPFKRLRTTTAYLMIALYGTDAERLALRKQIDTVHAQVRSGPDADVSFNAFDRDLQLWVASCLYKGVEDLVALIDPDLPQDELDDVVYPYAQRLGTTLQVKPEDWPDDRAAFEAYWQKGMAEIEMDDLTRSYLQGIAKLSFLVEPLGRFGQPLKPLLAPVGRLLTLGFLPEPFRDELGLPWSPSDQRRFDRVIETIVAVSKRLPQPVVAFPLNMYLWDSRRRLAAGKPIL